MALETWTAVFTLSAMRDTPEDVAESLNGLIGAQLQRELHPFLRERGWDFAQAWPEDHGWHSEARVPDGAKQLSAILITCPEHDGHDDHGGALNGRWRVVVGLNLGFFSRTKARRMDILRRLARDVTDGCRALKATDVEWENGDMP